MNTRSCVIAGLTVPVFLIFMLHVPSSFAAQEDTLSEADFLAAMMLGTNNLRSGIEHVAGPFTLEDYAVSVQRGEPTNITYRYKCPHDLPGDPNDFEIWVYTPPHRTLGKPQGQSPRRSCFSIIGSFAPPEIDAIVKAIPSDLDDFITPDMATFVHADYRGKLARDMPPPPTIHTLRRLADDLAQVLLTPSIAAAGFESLTSLGADSDMYKENGVWKLPRFLDPAVLTDPPTRSVEQEFVLFGDANDHDVSEILDLTRRVRGLERVTAVAVRSSLAYVRAHDGNPHLKLGSVFLSTPTASVTLRKDNVGWRVIREAYVAIRYPDYVDSLAKHSLLPKPPPQMVTALSDRVRWMPLGNPSASALSTQDRWTACELALRLRSAHVLNGVNWKRAVRGFF